MIERRIEACECRTEIIVPTLAEARRASLLRRAVESIKSQGGRPLVVVNGAHFDGSLVEELARGQGIRLLQVAEAGQANAVYAGRRSVACEYFGFLDDDDYLLPGSIAAREAFLATHPETDVVVANGLIGGRRDDPRLYKHPDDLSRIERDPLAALLEANWLASCGALYRASRVPPDLFLNLAKYAEWTDVAYRLIGDYRLGFIFENSFVTSDTAGSMSKHPAQARHLLELNYRMSSKIRTHRQKQLWKKRICGLHHQVAVDELAAENRKEAWRHHFRSLLVAPEIGVRYLTFSRRLLR